MSRHMTAVLTASAILMPALATTNAASLSTIASGSKGKTEKAESQAFVPTQADCDLQKDGVVDVSDMIKVIQVYGSDCSINSCEGDINRDGTVDMNDLLAVLANYGVIPVGPVAQTSLSGARVIMQSQFSKDASSLAELGVKNDCWVVHGYAVEMARHTTEEAFFNMSPADIESRFGRYLVKHTQLGTDFDGKLILDLESPFHPRAFGDYIDPESPKYDPLKFNAIVEGYKMRIAVVREMLPNCQLGLYGFPTPHAHGDANNPTEMRRTLGYELAAALGIMDQVDILCPVIYQRFGSQDIQHARIADYTKLGVNTGRKLTRTDGTTLEIQPLMALKIYNGSSVHHKELISIEDLANQIEVLRNEGIEEFMIWHGNDDLDEMTTVAERMGELKEELDYRNQDTKMVANAG